MNTSEYTHTNIGPSKWRKCVYKSQSRSHSTKQKSSEKSSTRVYGVAHHTLDHTAKSETIKDDRQTTNHQYNELKTKDFPRVFLDVNDEKPKTKDFH